MAIMCASLDLQTALLAVILELTTVLLEMLNITWYLLVLVNLNDQRAILVPGMFALPAIQIEKRAVTSGKKTVCNVKLMITLFLQDLANLNDLRTMSLIHKMFADFVMRTEKHAVVVGNKTVSHAMQEST